MLLLSLESTAHKKETSEVFKKNCIFPSSMVDEIKADHIYEQIKSKLLGQEGKIVAIDTDTGDFFIGNSVIDAYEKGHRKYPIKEFFFKRIGHKAVYRVG